LCTEEVLSWRNRNPRPKNEIGYFFQSLREYLATTPHAAPDALDGMIMAGSTCQYAGFGCYVTAHDAKTGGFQAGGSD
jgi:hypothetical protein